MPKTYNLPEDINAREREVMSQIHVLDHPLIKHKLTRMRNKETSSQEFRALLKHISCLMGFEITRNMETVKTTVETPICEHEFEVLKDDHVVIVPILRAGLGMVDGLHELMPFAHVGHVGMYRDEDTKQPIEYYCKLPKESPESFVIVVDPMLATGGSAVDAIDNLKSRGCKNIVMMNLVAAPEGVAKMQEAHPDVDIYVAALDEGLNEAAYIVPGLGDAGDRIFGTK